MKNSQFHKIALAAALLATAGFASAQTAAVTTDTNASAMGDKTRTEVKNEAKMAERNGGIASGTVTSGPGVTMAHASTKGSGVSRAAVKHKARKAAHSRHGTSLGEASMTGTSSVHAKGEAMPGLRAEKRAEGRAAAKNAPGNEGSVGTTNTK
jgi:hypothetical protein